MDKKKMLHIQSFVKDERTSTRLSSLRLPRDLSLGGNKPKKIYAPNLNVVRNKHKNKEVVVRKVEKKNAKPNVPRNTRNTQNPRYVQTEGIFSEGTGEIRRPTRHVDRALTYKERDTVATMILPKINRNSWSISKKDEEVVIADLLADSESEAEDDIYAPIILSNEQSPADLNVNDASSVPDVKLINGFKKEDVKLENIKHEIINSSPEIRDTKAIKFLPEMEQDPVLDSAFSNYNRYSDSKPCLSLVKIPDSLPGKGVADDGNVDFQLSDMLEGRIGKILIRKSGRTELQIGRITYEIDTIHNSEFCEEVMAVSDSSLVPGIELNATKLGNIQEHYLITPMWRNLVRQKKES